MKQNKSPVRNKPCNSHKLLFLNKCRRYRISTKNNLKTLRLQLIARINSYYHCIKAEIQNKKISKKSLKKSQ